MAQATDNDKSPENDSETMMEKDDFIEWLTGLGIDSIGKDKALVIADEEEALIKIANDETNDGKDYCSKSFGLNDIDSVELIRRLRIVGSEKYSRYRCLVTIINHSNLTMVFRSDDFKYSVKDPSFDWGQANLRHDTPDKFEIQDDHSWQTLIWGKQDRTSCKGCVKYILNDASTTDDVPLWFSFSSKKNKTNKVGFSCESRAAAYDNWTDNSNLEDIDTMITLNGTKYTINKMCTNNKTNKATFTIKLGHIYSMPTSTGMQTGVATKNMGMDDNNSNYKERLEKMAGIISERMGSPVEAQSECFGCKHPLIDKNDDDDNKMNDNVRNEHGICVSGRWYHYDKRCLAKIECETCKSPLFDMIELKKLKIRARRGKCCFPYFGKLFIFLLHWTSGGNPDDLPCYRTFTMQVCDGTPTAGYTYGYYIGNGQDAAKEALTCTAYPAGLLNTDPDPGTFHQTSIMNGSSYTYIHWESDDLVLKGYWWVDENDWNKVFANHQSYDNDEEQFETKDFDAENDIFHLCSRSMNDSKSWLWVNDGGILKANGDADEDGWKDRQLFKFHFTARE